MKTLSGHTEPYAVLGHPIGHTLSPVMHNAAFEKLGRDAIYLALDVHPDDCMQVLEAMAKMGFRGVNLTVPHKEIAFRELKTLDESAKLLGAVNTVAFSDVGLVGHNTDGIGFLKAIEESFGQGVAGKKIFTLGTGGAGRAVALVSAQAGAESITLCDLDSERTEKVKKEVSQQYPATQIDVLTSLSGAEDRIQQCDLLVQATPVGLKPDDPCLIPEAGFRDGQWGFDLIYHLADTPFTRTAKANGAQAVNGLGMLLHQGAKAFEIWTGEPPPINDMRTALEKAVYG